MEETSIGLADLIEQVKRELLAKTPDGEIPFLCVDTVELNLQVTVKREGQGGIKIYVLEAGRKASQDNVQTVKVVLSPLLSKERLLDEYQKRHSEQLDNLASKSLDAVFKNIDDGSSLGQQF